MFELVNSDDFALSRQFLGQLSLNWFLELVFTLRKKKKAPNSL